MAKSKKAVRYTTSNATIPSRQTADTSTLIVVPVNTCPSCGSGLTHVGMTATTKEKILLCHNEQKAFKGEPLTEFIGDRTRRSIYNAIKNNEESTINIEDIVLN